MEIKNFTFKPANREISENTKKMESMYLHTCRKSLTGGYNRWLYSLFLEIPVRASHIIYMNISFGNR